MGQISLQVPQSGQSFATEGAKVAADISTLQTVINGNIDSTNIAAALAQSAIVNQSGQTVKGASIISTSQNTSSTTFTTLATPDQVTGIVLPSSGLIMVLYQATWSESVNSAAQAAIFVGANQLKRAPASGGAPTAQQVGIGGINTPNATVLSTNFVGLVSTASPSPAYSGDVSTGQVISTGGNGGPCYIFAAAGTYTISVQFLATSGSVTVSNRRLYAQALSFA